MWYLEGPINICLVHGFGTYSDGLVVYADSDHGDDFVKRRSQTFYIFTLSWWLISWKATLQPTISLFTSKAKYMSMTEGMKEWIWLHGPIQSLMLKVERLTLYCDGESVLSLTKNPIHQVYHDNTKHIYS